MKKTTLLTIFSGILLGFASSLLLSRIISTFFYTCWITATITFFAALAAWKLTIRASEITEAINPSTLRTLGICISLVPALAVFSFLSTVPLNVDRSFSVWMINDMYKNHSNISERALEETAAKFFAPQNGEIKRRVEEQKNLGNISEKFGIVYLTNSGRKTRFLDNLISKLYRLNKKYAQ